MKWQLEYKAWNILHNFFLSLKSFVSRFCNNLFVAEERKKCWILDFFNNHWELWSEKEKKNGMENPGITKKRHESIFIQWIFKLKKHSLSIVVKDLCTFSIHRCYRTAPINLFFFFFLWRIISATFWMCEKLRLWYEEYCLLCELLYHPNPAHLHIHRLLYYLFFLSSLPNLYVLFVFDFILFSQKVKNCIEHILIPHWRAQYSLECVGIDISIMKDACFQKMLDL